MWLELPIEEIRALIHSPSLLSAKVSEAWTVLVGYVGSDGSQAWEAGHCADLREAALGPRAC
eukprot:9983640-Alexandrium_andersonii.AAC.1